MPKWWCLKNLENYENLKKMSANVKRGKNNILRISHKKIKT